jgi:hypothetical protein
MAALRRLTAGFRALLRGSAADRDVGTRSTFGGGGGGPRARAFSRQGAPRRADLGGVTRRRRSAGGSENT